MNPDKERKHELMIAAAKDSIEDLGEKLYETIAPLYHIDVVTKHRAEVYRELIRKS